MLKSLLLFVLFILSLIRLQAQGITLVAPPNQSECQDLQALFDWQATNVLQYNLQVAYTAGFTDLVVNQILVNSEYSTTLPEYDRSYYWRVSCTFTDLTTAMSATWVLDTKPAPPTQMAPSNNATCLDTAFQFNWLPVAGANRYWLQISTTQDFSAIVYNNTNILTTSIALPGFSYNTTYYWRLKTIIGTCESPWSSVFKYSTRENPPMLIYPDNGELLVPFDVVLRWSASPQPQSYNLQVSISPEFDTLVVDLNGLTADTFKLNLSSYNTAYYWRVKGVYAVCQSNWAIARMFKTPYRPPTLFAPEDTSACVQLKVSFNWATVQGALAYRLQISMNQNFLSLISDIPGIKDNFTKVTLDSPLTKYYWRARVEDTSNTGLWSAIFSFTTTIKEPTLVSPKDNSTGEPRLMTFTWNEKYPGAIYRIQISKEPDFNFPEIDSSGITQPTFTMEVDSFNTVYYWRVSATYIICTSAWSATWSFKTKISPPELLEPANNNTGVPLDIQFKWKQVKDAQSYEIVVSKDSTFFEIFKGNKGLTGTMTIIMNFDPYTEYYWRMRAVNAESTSEWSSTFKFTTGARGPDIPMQLSPLNGSKLIPIDAVLAWEAAALADKYHVQLAKDEYFKTIIYNIAELIGLTTTVSGLEYYRVYYWRVSSVNAAGQSSWSPTWSFRTTALAPSDAPILTSPADNLEDTENYIKLLWSEVPRAEGYHLHISEDNTFPDNNLFYNSDKVWSNEAMIYDMNFDTRYYWRVAAFNEAGKTVWSNVWSFKTKVGSDVAESNIEGISIEIAPNPAKERANIIINLSSPASVKISIITVLGSIIKEGRIIDLMPGRNAVPFNIAGLVDGVYFVYVEIGGIWIIKRIAMMK